MLATIVEAGVVEPIWRPVGSPVRAAAGGSGRSVTPTTGMLSRVWGDAVEALGTAARACMLHLRLRGEPWKLAVALTGELLSGRPRDPPGF